MCSWLKHACVLMQMKEQMLGVASATAGRKTNRNLSTYHSCHVYIFVFIFSLLGSILLLFAVLAAISLMRAPGHPTCRGSGR